MSEATLDRALGGDQHAFGELIEPLTGELRVHCYRILGSLSEAEDALQETLLAAWRGLPGLADPAALRAWLYRIATNRCLNALRAARRRRPPEPVPPFDPTEPTTRAEITWLEPCPDTLLHDLPGTGPGPDVRHDAEEAVRLAFVAGLQRLAPRQRAVLVLRDVLGYPLADVATMLDLSATSAKGLLQRARAGLGQQPGPDGDHPVRLPARDDDVARRFAEAYVRDDVDAVVALMARHARMSMPPAPHEYLGVDAIGAHLRAFAAWRGPRRLHLLATGANRQPAFGCYLDRADGVSADAAGLVVLGLAGGEITGLTFFLGVDLTGRFGLPASLAGAPTASPTA